MKIIGLCDRTYNDVFYDLRLDIFCGSILVVYAKYLYAHFVYTERHDRTQQFTVQTSFLTIGMIILTHRQYPAQVPEG